MDKLAFKAFWNSLLLSVTFLFWLLNGYKHDYIVVTAIGLLALIFTSIDTYQFYKLMKETNNASR